MRWRILTALAAVGLLGAGLYWAGRHERRTASASRDAARLPAFDDRLVTALTLEGEARAIRVERSGGRWRIVAPVEDRASAAAIEAILAAARRTPIVQAVPVDGAVASFGLDPATAKLTLEGVDVPALSIGRTVPTGEGLYARLAGREDVLVLRLPDARPLQTAALAGLREPRWVEAQPSEITAVELAPGGIVLRRDAGTWWIEAPQRLPASPARVEALLAALAAARIVAWDDTGVSAEGAGLGPDARRFVVRGGSSSQTVTLGRPDGEGRVYARAEGRSAVLRVAIDAAHLAPDVASLRETRLTNVNRYRVSRLTYVSGASRFAAARGADGSWTAEGGAPVAADRMLRLLVGLLEAPTSAYGPGAPSGTRDAAIDYATDDGASGRIEVYADRAIWSGAPGTSFRLAAALPPVPASEP